MNRIQTLIIATLLVATPYAQAANTQRVVSVVAGKTSARTVVNTLKNGANLVTTAIKNGTHTLTQAATSHPKVAAAIVGGTALAAVTGGVYWAWKHRATKTGEKLTNNGQIINILPVDNHQVHKSVNEGHTATNAIAQLVKKADATGTLTAKAKKQQKVARATIAQAAALYDPKTATRVVKAYFLCIAFQRADAADAEAGTFTLKGQTFNCDIDEFVKNPEQVKALDTYINSLILPSHTARNIALATAGVAMVATGIGAATTQGRACAQTALAAIGTHSRSMFNSLKTLPVRQYGKQICSSFAGFVARMRHVVKRA